MVSRPTVSVENGGPEEGTDAVAKEDIMRTAEHDSVISPMREMLFEGDARQIGKVLFHRGGESGGNEHIERGERGIFFEQSAETGALRSAAGGEHEHAPAAAEKSGRTQCGFDAEHGEGEAAAQPRSAKRSHRIAGEDERSDGKTARLGQGGGDEGTDLPFALFAVRRVRIVAYIGEALLRKARGTFAKQGQPAHAAVKK